MAHLAEREIPTYPLRDYAFCADGERGMVVGPDGTIVWLCAPRWDSDAVFSRLLAGRGGFSIAPRMTPRVSGGYYETGTLIWHHTWTTGSGDIECVDALAYPGEDGRAIVLRRIEAADDDVVLDVSLAPRAEFGAADVTPARLEDGVWTWSTGDLDVRVIGLEGAKFTDDGALVGELDVPAGGSHDVVVELAARGDSTAADRSSAARDLNPDALWSRTRRAWRDAVPEVSGTAADANVTKFYALAHGLTSKHGGMVAAATTGLPERLHGTRNYDYRYAWIRDQCFTGQADAAYGGHVLLDGTVAFIAARLRADGENLRPAYTVVGEPVPDERSLPVPGYPGATPIAGNHANEQFQLDAFGEVLALFAQAARMERLDADGWEAARIAADAIASRWEEPDAGIWELDNRWWTHSRLACIGGLRSIAAYASDDDARRWRELADLIEVRLHDTCVTAQGAWKRAEDDDAPDAALVIPALRGGLDPQGTANARTVDAVLRELERDGHLFRFAHGDEALGSAEGAFLVCEASMALALLRLGRREEAWRWFERASGRVGAAGLFSEEWDPLESQMRGNLPQAFVHAMMAQAAIELGR